jgi:hypothetical protein
MGRVKIAGYFNREMQDNEGWNPGDGYRKGKNPH